MTIVSMDRRIRICIWSTLVSATGALMHETAQMRQTMNLTHSTYIWRYAIT